MRTIKDTLKFPSLYLFSQAILGAKRARKYCIDEYAWPQPGMRVRDIGCGPGIRYLDRTDVEAVAVKFREVFNDVAKTTTNIAYPHPRLRPCLFVDAIFSRSFGTQDCLGEQI